MLIQMISSSVYHVGSPDGWSEVYSFKAMENGTVWPVRLAVFGDMGDDNAQSLGRLQEESQRGHFDAILHVGVYTSDSAPKFYYIIVMPCIVIYYYSNSVLFDLFLPYRLDNTLFYLVFRQ